MKQLSPDSRRAFLFQAAAVTAAATGLAPEVLGQTLGNQSTGRKPNLQQSGSQIPNAQDQVTLPPLHDTSTEAPEKLPGPFEAPAQRTGFAIVGLGDLALAQILPAFGSTKYCKPVALVSGDRNKASKVAAQYGIRDSAIYDYSTYDQLAQNPEVQVIYIVLPNSMHAEFTVRGAEAGKHILTEKPMATSVKDCQRMIEACNAAGVKLMVAYRQQYEPNNRAIAKAIRAGKLGKLRQFLATNSQNQGNPEQWRQNLKLAGGGCMPDVGIYCLNAARFLSGEEPTEVLATTFQPREDPRFREVEASCQVIARFPSGYTAIFNSSYDSHRSQSFRMEGSEAWAEMSPAFGYHGLKTRFQLLDREMATDVVLEPSIPDKDQFALEMDHMALCVQQNLMPHTPGEEGLQDQRITDAIYESARTGRAVKIALPAGPTRGPEPAEA